MWRVDGVATITLDRYSARGYYTDTELIDDSRKTMEPFFTAADLFVRNGLRTTRAYSALPDAPVQPYTERRTRNRRAAAFIRQSIRRPVVGSRRARYSTECLSH